MASGDSPHAHPPAAPGAVFIQSLDRVLAASRMIAALAAHPVAKRSAVEEDELDKEPTHWVGEKLSVAAK
jgi:hypothetical protein